MAEPMDSGVCICSDKGLGCSQAAGPFDTRVPVQTLLDYIEAGDSIDDFRDGFPTVKREQVIAFLEQAKDRLVASASRSSCTTAKTNCCSRVILRPSILP